MNQSTSSPHVQTPTGSSFPPPGGHVTLASPQYGPAWVADCYGTTHEQRLAAVLDVVVRREARARWREAPRDAVAVAYATVLTEHSQEIEVAVAFPDDVALTPVAERVPVPEVKRGPPMIDDPDGTPYRPAPEWVHRACARRFESSMPTAYHPDKPGWYLHGIGNFWDGPTEVKDNGDGSLSFTNPYTGETDRFSGEHVDVAPPPDPQMGRPVHDVSLPEPMNQSTGSSADQ